MRNTPSGGSQTNCNYGGVNACGITFKVVPLRERSDALVVVISTPSNSESRKYRRLAGDDYTRPWAQALYKGAAVAIAFR